MLPTFDVQRLPERRAWGRVTCSRCGNWFIVHVAKWRRASKYLARSCPHCFKTSWIPNPTKDEK